MSSFLTEYFGILEGTGEQAVLCPFPHHTGSGIAYQENNPSAHVNTDEKVFHCKACAKGLSELQFIQEILATDYGQARKIQLAFTSNESVEEWDSQVNLSEETKNRALGLGITEDVIETLKIRTPAVPLAQDILAFPVFMYNKLLDIRMYDPGKKPKIRSRRNAPAGLIIPFDIWTTDNKVTLICAGEKDMAVARSHGFNAITITGGEMALPLGLKYFEDRKVAILYDNDNTGIEGGKKLAEALLPYAKEVKVVTGFHEVCVEKGEDLTDFFMKYNKTRDELIQYIQNTVPFTVQDAVALKENKQKYDLVTIRQAASPAYLGKVVQSNIQVIATVDQLFVTPTSAIAEKVKLSGRDDTLAVGDLKEWALHPHNAEHILHLIDNSFKEDTIKDNLKTLMYIPAKERNVRIKYLATQTVFKAQVTDLFEAADFSEMSSTVAEEMLCYSIGHKLESGKKYCVTYKIVPHPYKGQQLLMIVLNTSQANDSVTQFKVTEEVKAHLRLFQDTGPTVERRVDNIARKVKGLLGYNGNDTLIKTIDLSFHTVLSFNFGPHKNVRGYLDTLVVGESRMGKSSTAKALRDAYGLGTFVSLAGNSATIAGLVGGANKNASGSFQTRAGIIPQNHQGLIVFEELGKSATNVLAELTDIRSSNEVRISRVSGYTTLPAWVRMIALSNTKESNGEMTPIAAYPNGIEIIKDLVPSAADIARYDIMLVLSDRGQSIINPLWTPEEPFPIEAYRSRIRWVWSRTQEQITMTPYVQELVVTKSNELNKDYDGHLKLFGTEAWKKLLRVAIAVAGYTASTDDTYENIVVKGEHVTYAAEFLQSIYDNDTFKLKQYIEQERLLSTTNEEAVALLQDIWIKTPALVLQLEKRASMTRTMLASTTGLTNDELTRALNRLTRGMFIDVSDAKIKPTERFRLTVALIERNTHVNPVGEV